jgi:hypothetical protein
MKKQRLVYKLDTRRCQYILLLKGLTADRYTFECSYCQTF